MELTSPPVPGPAPDTAPAAVLLVDDHPTTLDSMSAALEGLGARIVCAGSGEEALRRLLSDDFAVVLLDVVMPAGLSGLETAQHMRRRERSRSTPIIFVTGLDPDGRASGLGYDLGAVDVLFKPVDPSIVRAKVRVFLELYRLRDQSARLLHARLVNEELMKAAQHAEEARQAKDRFLTTMSHEIRTPINAVLGYAQLMDLGLAGPLTPEQRGYLDRLTASSRHLLGLVSDVLDLARMDADEMQLESAPRWTGRAVAAALELTAPLAAARGIRMVDGRPGDRGVPYVGDEHRVRQILVNLLANAVKFTERGGTVRVECDAVQAALPRAGAQGSTSWAVVQVSDTGIGIAEQSQDAIFEPFHQVESGHTRIHGGSGLGLAISRRFARLMGGELTVESVVGTGSTFTLWLSTTGEGSAEPPHYVGGLPAPVPRGLTPIGRSLRSGVDDVVHAYASRLRTDAAIPSARQLRQPALEDHAVTYLMDLAQSLIIVDEADGEARELIQDATEIQRVIAERHGARRHQQGWGEDEIKREFVVLTEETERVVRSDTAASPEEMERAIDVLRKLIARAEELSRGAFRRAVQREH